MRKSSNVNLLGPTGNRIKFVRYGPKSQLLPFNANRAGAGTAKGQKNSDRTYQLRDLSNLLGIYRGVQRFRRRRHQQGLR